MKRERLKWGVLGALGLLAVCLAAVGAAAQVQILGTNESGMHCMDSDYSIWNILPPSNNQKVQVVQKATSGNPQLLGSADVNVTYRAIADPTGSINTTSVGKTNFWTYANSIYGITPAADTGFQGMKMPGTGNTPQSFLNTFFDAATNRWSAPGIPITPFNDKNKSKPYPLFQLEAKDAGNAVLSGISVVVPVSQEMYCINCHATNKVAAKKGFRGVTNWSIVKNKDLQARQNVLILHDAAFGTSLQSNEPVACASCHYSTASDLLVNGTVTGNLTGVHKDGDAPPKTAEYTLSAVMHWRHGSAQGTANNAIPVDPGKFQGTALCYNCHPGKKTKCYRGAMAKAGISCQDCHGGLLAVAGMDAGKVPLIWTTTTNQRRRPWMDLPLCQSCHTGDAVSHLGSDLILETAYDTANAASASPRIATNKRFAEPDSGGLPQLFKDSLGHSGIACQNCHGSQHAIWPTAQKNDNIAATQIQGYPGRITECSVCHASALSPTLEGPHGMHNVDQSWVDAHMDFYDSNSDSCRACHGQNLEGTVLSETATKRTYSVENGNKTLAAGTPVSCRLCHGAP